MKTDTAVKLAIIAGAGLAAYFGLRYAGKTVTQAAGAAWDGVKDITVKVADAVNPTSSNNLAYRATNAFTQAVTNDPSATLGTKLWELFNPSAVQAERDALAATGGTVIAPTWTAADQDDADMGYYMDVFRAENSGPALNYRLRR